MPAKVLALLVFALAIIFDSVLCTVLGSPREADCCKAKSSSWSQYNRELNLDGLCDIGYHLPEDATSSETQFAAQCLTSSQKRRIQNPSNGYFLVTEASLNNCYRNPTECSKYIMVCVSDDCHKDTQPPTSQWTTKAPTPSFDCTKDPIPFTTTFVGTSAPSPYSNWQHSFPVRMGIVAQNSAFIGQIKLFWTTDPDAFPSDIIPCNGIAVDFAKYPLLHDTLAFDSNFNGILPNCDDKVIIRYSDEDDIEFGSDGGVDQLPQFDVSHNADLLIKPNKLQCKFDNVQYVEIVHGPKDESFDQMQPYLAMNILIATDFVDPSTFAVGELVIFAGVEIAVPENGLIPCDGSIYSIYTFPALFSIVEDKYFYNITHFGIPDCSGKALISTEAVEVIGESVGSVDQSNIPRHSQHETIALTSDGCTADIDAHYDNDCVNVNNIMPVLPALFVLDDDTNEFRLFIVESDTSALSTVTYLNGIAFASHEALDKWRGSDQILCDTLSYYHKHEYSLQCPVTETPTTQPTPEPTPKPSKSPTTTSPTLQPSTAPTTDPTREPTRSPTPALCEFKPSDSQSYEFAIVVDNSCGLTDDECRSQLQLLAELLLIIKVDNPPFYTKVAYIPYGAGNATVHISLNDELQHNITAFYNHVINECPCGGDGNGKTNLVNGIDVALNEFVQHGSTDTTHRKVFIIQNCRNTVGNTTTEICNRLYNELDVTVSNPIDRVVINMPYSASANNSITSPDIYLDCFVRARLGAPTGMVCSGDDGYDYTVDEECREDGICNEAQRIIPDPTSSPSPSPTTEPTFDPTTDPTVDPTTEPTFDPTVDPTTDPTVDPTVDPTTEPTVDPTTDPTVDPTSDPTVEPTVEPTDFPTWNPTPNPTELPTFHPTDIPTLEPTAEPTNSPTPPLCEFVPSATQSYEFAIIVDNSCGLTVDECKIQLEQIAELLLIIKVDNPPYYTKVTYIEYGSGNASVHVGLNDNAFQNNTEAFYNHIVNECPCGGDGNGTTNLVNGIETAIVEFSSIVSTASTYRKIFIINNCENNVKSTEICTRLYDELDFTFRNPIDRVIINVPYGTDSIQSPMQYLMCFVRSRSGSPTGTICSGTGTKQDYDFTLDDVCREDGLCNEAQRIIPDPTSSPSPSPTTEPTVDPTLEPTTLNPTHCSGNKTTPTQKPKYETCCDKIADEIIDEKDCIQPKKQYYEMYLSTFQCNEHCKSFDASLSSNAGAAIDCFKIWSEYTMLYLVCNNNLQLTDWSYYENNKDICFMCNKYQADDPECSTSAPTVSTDLPTTLPTLEPTLEPTFNPITKLPTTSYPTSSPTPHSCPIEPGSFYVTRNKYELAIIVDNSCGLTDDECKIQLEQVADLFLTIKVDIPPNNITRIAFVEYGESGANVSVGLNDALQLNTDDFYNYIINSGACGDGGNGKTDLVSGINKTLEEFIEYGDDDDATVRKIFIINNCVNNVQDTDSEICDKLYRALEGQFVQQIDRTIINIPAPSDRATNTINGDSAEYLNCLVRSNSVGQETGGICAAPDDGEITSNDYIDLYFDDECREEYICGFTGRIRPDPTRAPTSTPSLTPTTEPTLELTTDPTVDPSVEPTLEPTIYPTVDPTRTNIWPTVHPTTNKTGGCPPNHSGWSKWSKWSACFMYIDPDNDAHVKHIRYRRRDCTCFDHGAATCTGPIFEVEECETDCVAMWGGWCPWSICIIQDFECITDVSGDGVCNGFQFRTRACLKNLPNNKDVCDSNCTCEPDQWGNFSKETRTCTTVDCLQIVFENGGDDTCLPQWRLEIEDNDILLKDQIVQLGGTIGDDCIPVSADNEYWLVVTRGCGAIKWYYRGKMLGSYRYDGSVASDDHKSLQIEIPSDNVSKHKSTKQI